MPSYLVVAPYSDHLSLAAKLVKEHLGLKDLTITSPDIFLLSNIVDIQNDTIGIDIVKEVTRFVSLTPVQMDNKVVILESFEKTTIQAQNALLKTLEDSPNYVYFYLITRSLNKVLETIRSRCIPIFGDTSEIGVKDGYEQIVTTVISGDLTALLELLDKAEHLDPMIVLSQLKREASTRLDPQKYRDVLKLLIKANEYMSVYIPFKDVLVWLTSKMRLITQ